MGRPVRWAARFLLPNVGVGVHSRPANVLSNLLAVGRPYIAISSRSMYSNREANAFAFASVGRTFTGIIWSTASPRSTAVPCHDAQV